MAEQNSTPGTVGGLQRRKLADYSPAQQRDMPYERLTKLRREAWREFIDTKIVESDRADLTRFREVMEAKHGPAVKAHHNAVRWDVAFMIGRYGEEPAHWPTTLSDTDRVRLAEWDAAEMFAVGIRKLGKSVRLSNSETLHGLEEFGDAIEILDPLDDEPATGDAGAMTADPVVVNRQTAPGRTVDEPSGDNGQGGGTGGIGRAAIALLITLATSLGATMSNMSDYLESGIVTLLYRTGAGIAKPAGIYHALYTAMPGETGGGTEVTGGSYARVNLAPLDANWAATAGGDGHTENLVAITWPAPTANWGTVVGFGQHDAAAAGNLLIYGGLTANKTVNNGDAAPSFPIGALDITFA